MTRLYEAFADLLEYPGADWAEKLDCCEEFLACDLPELLSGYGEFRSGVEGLAVAALQELYTQTFDLNPVCALEVGYHLFGENYKRGIFLANLRETESPYELKQSGQLPDYLPVLLRLVLRLEDDELRTALIAECLVPALTKMAEALDAGANPYRELIAVINESLKAECPEWETAGSLAAVGTAAGAPEFYQITTMK